jgi:hypothetical protein
VGVRCNECADQLAGDAGIEWNVPDSDFLPLSRVMLFEGWQMGYPSHDMGRYTYSIWVVVSFFSWFRRFDGD